MLLDAEVAERQQQRGCRVQLQQLCPAGSSISSENPDLAALMVSWARYAYTAVADQMAAAADAPSPWGARVHAVRSSTYRRAEVAPAATTMRCHGHVSVASAATAKGQPAGVPALGRTNTPTASPILIRLGAA